MSKTVNGLEDALQLLKLMNIKWSTVNKIQNSMWETGVAFFGGKHHQRLAYYDETQNILTTY